MRSRVPPPRGLRLVVGSPDVVMLQLPRREERWPPSLTAAERAVGGMLIEGAPNAEIARRRGTSECTVANQVASIFRKTGVGSRAELAASVFGR